jgi:hypothetical protein
MKLHFIQIQQPSLTGNKAGFLVVGKQGAKARRVSCSGSVAPRISLLQSCIQNCATPVTRTRGQKGNNPFLLNNVLNTNKACFRPAVFRLAFLHKGKITLNAVKVNP